MKKFLLLFLLISSFCYSQIEYVPSLITFKNGKVIKSKILFETNRFHKGFLDEQSITDVFVKTGEKGKRYVKYPVNDIKKVEFVDLQNQPRIFKSVPDYRGLVEAKLEGNISWYRVYNRSTFDGKTEIADYLQKGEETKNVFSFLSNDRKKLEELTSDKPQVVSVIDQLDFSKFKDEDLLEILKKYNG